MLLKLSLLGSFFILFYSLLIGQFPDKDKVKNLSVRYLYPGGSALAAFLIGNWVFITLLAGIILAILGWFVPDYIRSKIKLSKRKKARVLAKDFIASASGLYAAGQQTTEVIYAMSKRFPEPFATEFQAMVGQRLLNKDASYPDMLRKLSEKYELPELEAGAAIIESSEKAGGPLAIASGLKKLAGALRKRDKLILEREKANMEPKIASAVVIVILGLGLALDATLWRDMYIKDGRVLLAAGLGITVGLIFMNAKVSTSKDL